MSSIICRIPTVVSIVMLMMFVPFTSPANAQQAIQQNPQARFTTAQKSVGGQVGRLPGASDREERGELLGGHVRLLATSMDQAINNLQNGDLREFATKYTQMVESYNQLADHVGEAASSIGDAETQIALAQSRLDATSDAPSVDSASRNQLDEDINQIRAMLLGKLRSTRVRHSQADADEQKTLLRQIHGIVQRIKQLDGLSASITSGTRPILPEIASSKLQGHVSALQESLREEERLLNVVAQSVRLLVDATTKEMHRTIKLLEIEASIPRSQIADLTATRKDVQQILTDIRAAHQRASETATRILSTGSDAFNSAVNESAVLQVADELLRTD